MSATPQVPRDFEPVESEQEALKLLWEAGRIHASAFLWTKEPQKLTLESTILAALHDHKILVVDFISDETTRQWVDAFAEMSAPEALFSISLSGANIFFSARFKAHDAAGFQFIYPERIFKVQRRKDMRISIPDGYVMKVEIPNPNRPKEMLAKKLVDLSAGGLAFAADEGEQQLFPMGGTITGLSITIKGKKLVMNGEIRHNRSFSKDTRAPGYKVGVQFKDMKAGDTQWLAAYVFEESRKIYARFLG